MAYTIPVALRYARRIMQDMQQNSAFAVKKGRGHGQGRTTARCIRIPPALWDRAGELGLDRSQICRDGLIKAIEEIERKFLKDRKVA